MLMLQTVDQIDSMIQRDFVEVDDVLAVPTDNAAAVSRAGDGDVEGVGGPFRRDDAGLQVAIAQADGFDGDVDEFSPRQVFLIDLANALGRILKFIDDDGRDDQLKAPGFDLGEEFPARRVDSRIEDASVNGSVGINSDGHGRMLSAGAVQGNACQSAVAFLHIVLFSFKATRASMA